MVVNLMTEQVDKLIDLDELKLFGMFRECDAETEQRKWRANMYLYGMRLRGFSIGCQPKDGLVERRDDMSGKYYDILAYNRPLTEKELADYELDYIGGEAEE